MHQKPAGMFLVGIFGPVFNMAATTNAPTGGSGWSGSYAQGGQHFRIFRQRFVAQMVERSL